MKGTREDRQRPANRSLSKPEDRGAVPAGGTSTGSSNGQDPAEKVAEELLTIYRSTPPVDKEDAELSGEAYVEYFLELLLIQEEKEDWEKWPRTGDVYARLDNPDVEDVKISNIPSSFVLQIEHSKTKKTANGFRSTRTSYEPRNQFNSLWEAARELGFEEAGELAGTVAAGQDGPRAPGGEEAGKLAARLAGGPGGGGERSGNDVPSKGTNGFADRPSDTPQNRPSERSDSESAVDLSAVNPPVTARCNRDQWAWLTTRTKSLSEQWLYLYLERCDRAGTYGSGEDEDRWVVVGSETLHDEFAVSYPTKTVWQDSDLIEAWEDGRYISPQEAEVRGMDAKARKFRVKGEALDEWTRRGAEGGSYRYKAHRRELVRTSEPPTLRTDTMDDNDNRYPELIDRALRILKEADHELILDAIEDAEEAIAEEEGAEARDQLTSLRLAKETVKRQVIQAQDGVAKLQNAYEVQEISGRLGFKLGGPQNLLGEVKARAYAIDGLCNYDISECHTSALRQVAKKLEQVGVHIDLSPWTEYPGKYAVADDTGLPVSLIKIVEHAVKYGAVIPRSMSQAEDYFEEVCGYKISIAEEVKKHAQKGLIDDPDEALKTLYDVFEPMRQVVKEIAAALLGPYYQAKQRGGYMHNACGISFLPSNHEEGHDREAAVMAWMLQGLEAAFIHSITILGDRSDEFSVIANEHDGCIVKGEIPQEAIEVARHMSGFHEAELVEKDFADEEDVEELYGTENEKEDQEGTEEEEEEQAVARGPRQAPRRNGDTETNAEEVATNPAGFPMARAGPG